MASPPAPPLPPAQSQPRRHLTILFTDLSDSTRLSGLMEAEVFAELLDDLRLAFETVVAEHHGTTNQYQGDGLQALFGNPRATEDDGRRATEAALAIHERVRALRAKYSVHGAPDLSVHSGIHTGVVLVREGDRISARLELFGPAPGLAKHLSDLAERDEILVSEETLGPGSHFFHADTRRLVTLKGRETSLAIHPILARAAPRTRFEAHTRRGLVPFIGRRHELQQLGQALERASAREPGFVIISAQAGVGKTRLAEEFLRRAAESSCTIHRGYCEDELSAEPLQPFLQMLRSHFGLAPGTPSAAAAQAIEAGLSTIDSALLAHLPVLLQALSLQVDAADGSAAARRAPAEQTIAALCSLFAALAETQLQILFIDDWQWADAATRQVAYAIRGLARHRILLLATTRPLELGDAQLAAPQVLELGVFTDAEADTTIGELLPDVDPFVASDIRRYAGGNPLFIEELCHSAAGAGPRATFNPLLGSSAWLKRMIASRVSRLPPEQAEVLSAAAVIGTVVPAWLLERVTGCDSAHPLVHALARQDLIFPGEHDGMLRFKHGITRDVVYGALGLQARQAMHRRIAQLIRERTEPGAEAEACETLAYHHDRAAEPAEGARYAEMAGDKAMATSSIDRAKAQYQAALEMLEREPPSPARYQTWRSVARRFGMASVYDPSRGDLEVFHRAVTLAREHHDAAGLAYAEYWLAYAHYALGESRPAVEHCELALQAAAGLGDARLVAQIRAIHGQALAAAGDYGAALDLLEAAAEAGRSRRTPGTKPPGLAYLLACTASVLGDRGEFAQAHSTFEEALEAVPWPGHEVESSVLCWRSAIHLWQGNWNAAHTDALAAQAIAERVKSLYQLGMSCGLGVYAEWRLGLPQRPLDDLVTAVSWLESHDKNLFVSLNYGWLAEGMAAQGRAVEARRYAARALQRARQRDLIGAAMACRALARLDAGRGDWRAAERHLRLADAAAQMRGSARERACNDLCRAEVSIARGAREPAIERLERAAEAFLDMGMAWHLAQATQLREAI